MRLRPRFESWFYLQLGNHFRSQLARDNVDPLSGPNSFLTLLSYKCLEINFFAHDISKLHSSTKASEETNITCVGCSSFVRGIRSKP